MRFDDMLATVLALPRETADERIGVWRQLVDLLAQRDEIAASSDHIEAFALFDQWSEEIPDRAKMDMAKALAGRDLTPWLLASFADERPETAAPIMLQSHLEEEEWLALLPSMRASSRALLRHRTDLPQSVVEALDRYGAADLILEGTSDIADEAEILTLGEDQIVEEELDHADRETAQIRELVARIEAFRRERKNRPVPAPPVEEAINEFRFEAGPDGVINWVEGAPRGPIIGQTIAFSADALSDGVDGHAAGAFRQRAPFRDARLVVAGQGAAAGAWRISAVPFFTESDGRFAGYRGMARRPQRGEEAGLGGDKPSGVFGTGLGPDALRELIHELRTPLNAIVGFSEMIDKQLLGPVAAAYRDRAAGIAAEAAALLRSVDDLDTAARVETDRLALDVDRVDGAEILQRLHDDYAGLAEKRGVKLAMRIEEGLPALAADPIAAERMIERLLSATVGLAAQGETIDVACSADGSGDTVHLSFARPRFLAGKDETQLLDPGYSPEGDWPDAPALGLGFALRLVRNIAKETNGRLDIDADNFVLHLPAKDASALSGERGQ